MSIATTIGESIQIGNQQITRTDQSLYRINELPVHVCTYPQQGHTSTVIHEIASAFAQIKDAETIKKRYYNSNYCIDRLESQLTRARYLHTIRLWDSNEGIPGPLMAWGEIFIYGTESPEICYLVIPEFQNGSKFGTRGIGTLTAYTMLAFCEQQRLGNVVARVAADNHGSQTVMRSLLNSFGGRADEIEGGVDYTITVPHLVDSMPTEV